MKRNALTVWAVWLSSALAISAGLYFTHDIKCLWFLLIPACVKVSMQKDEDKKESEKYMADNIFEKLTDEEQNNLWMYMIFNKDKIKEKTEQWTKEAEKAGMTLTEYLDSINPLNDAKMEDK